MLFVLLSMTRAKLGAYSLRLDTKAAASLLGRANPDVADEPSGHEARFEYTQDTDGREPCNPTVRIGGPRSSAFPKWH
jgi:hypothetical protein